MKIRNGLDGINIILMTNIATDNFTPFIVTTGWTSEVRLQAEVRFSERKLLCSKIANGPYHEKVESYPSPQILFLEGTTGITFTSKPRRPTYPLSLQTSGQRCVWIISFTCVTCFSALVLHECGWLASPLFLDGILYSLWNSSLTIVILYNKP
jgi:hypothetical protein